MINRKIVPEDSALTYWLDYLAITEVPVSYQILTALSAIGSLMKRRVYVDQLEWKVYPNMSVLLVGPSGIGKDIAIDSALKIVEAIATVPVITGKTMEYIKQELLLLGDPACCFTPANELTAFLGGKDYQKSMVQELTALLSTGSSCDVSTKSEGKQFIMRPTVTMQAGSTAEWLHKAMPEGSAEGGFLPRFVIICEDYGKRHIPFVKYSVDLADRRRAESSRGIFFEVVSDIVHNTRSGELFPTADGMEFYTNWYCNRFSYFSPSVLAYANRSRDHIQRIAMLMALSRRHTWLDEVDYRFAATVAEAVAANIETALAPKKAYEQSIRKR